MATLTSLLTPVKIDGDPSGQTCEQGGGSRWKGGGEGEERERDKASNKLARTSPVHADSHNHARTHTLKSMTL